MESRSEDTDEAIDPRMVNIIEQMFTRCYADSGKKIYKHKHIILLIVCDMSTIQ